METGMWLLPSLKAKICPGNSNWTRICKMDSLSYNHWYFYIKISNYDKHMACRDSWPLELIDSPICAIHEKCLLLYDESAGFRTVNHWVSFSTSCDSVWYNETTRSWVMFKFFGFCFLDRMCSECNARLTSGLFWHVSDGAQLPLISRSTYIPLSRVSTIESRAYTRSILIGVLQTIGSEDMCITV